MSGLKDNLLLKKEGVELSIQETEFSVLTFLRGFPKRKKLLLTVLALAFIPLIIGVRIGSRILAERQLAAALIQAHPSYSAPLNPTIGAVKLINSGRGWYSAYVQISNDNLDLAAPAVPYKFEFSNAAGEQVASTVGATYLLPNQKKYLVVSRLDAASQQLTGGKLTLGDFQWQKRLAIPEVSLKAAAPIISNELNPLTLVAEGAVVNNSPYELGAVRLVFMLYDKTNAIVAVSQRDEFNLPAYGRRAYKQTWPDLYQGDIARAVVMPETNAADGNNLISRNTSAPPAAATGGQ